MLPQPGTNKCRGAAFRADLRLLSNYANASHTALCFRAQKLADGASKLPRQRIGYAVRMSWLGIRLGRWLWK